MKLLFFPLILFVCAAVGTAQSKEVSETQFHDVVLRAQELQKATSYIQKRILEYFEDRNKPGRVAERDLFESLATGEWRSVEERNYANKPTVEERLWDGKALFQRSNKGPWKKYDGGSGSGMDIQTGKFQFRYEYLGKENLDGQSADLYQERRDRVARKPSRDGIVEYHYVRLTKYWFMNGGRLLKKVVEETVAGNDALSRETTTIDYNPNGLKIEAPIK